MRVRLAIPEEHVKPNVLDAALEATTRLDEHLLRSGEVPTWDEAVARGVKWRPEPPGDEHFDNAKVVMGRGWGDCDDVAPWAAATMRVTGQDTRARAVVRRSGPNRWHAVVQRGDGSLRDPSREAGMVVNGGVAPAVCGMMFRAPRGVNGVVDTRPAIAVRAMPGRRWAARVDLPWNETDYALSNIRSGPVPAQAIAGACMGASILGQVSRVVAPHHVDCLKAIAGLASGYQPRDLMGACSSASIERAMRFVHDCLHANGHTPLARP